MNKGIFTLMTAALLSAGSAVMPVNAASEITAYSTVNKDKVLANGVKFYLQKSTDCLLYTSDAADDVPAV